MSLAIILLLGLAFLLFLLRAFGVTHPRVELTALGLAAWVLTVLLGATSR